MNRNEKNRFKQLEQTVRDMRKANQSDTLRDEVKNRNLSIMQMYMNDIFESLEEESVKQKKPICRDDV